MSDNQNIEEQIGRWIDGDLGPEEARAFEAAMERDPSLRRQAEEAARVGELLRSHWPARRDVRDPQAFNAAVLQAIGGAAGRDAPGPAGEGPDAADGERVVPGPASWFFRLPWAVAAAACVVALVSFLNRGEPAPASAGVVYAPDPQVHADIFFDADAGATIVLLDGLEELPPDHEVKPYRVAEYRGNAASDRIVLVSEEDPSRPLYVLLPGGDGRHSVHAIE